MFKFTLDPTPKTKYADGDWGLLIEEADWFIGGKVPKWAFEPPPSYPVFDGDIGDILPGQPILVPTFEIAANPTIRISEVKARRFYIIDRAQIMAKEQIQKEEDEAIFAAISSIM